VRTEDHRRRRCGRRLTTGSCGPPRSGGRARGARTAASNDELTKEEAVGEEALGLEAIAVGLGLKVVLDK
jgi:hypothetical protein